MVAPEFPPETGGMQTYAYELARGLTRRGHAVTVMTKGEPRSMDRVGEIEPVLESRWFKDRRTIRHRADDFDIWHALNAAYAWIALEVGPVVVSVHGNDLLRPNPIAPLDLSGRYGLPWSSRLDLKISRWRTARLLRKAVPRVEHFIANSESTRRILLRRCGPLPERTSVGYVGVARQFLESATSEKDEGSAPRFLTVARLSERRKNVDVVLRALARLKERHAFTYQVVGDGSLRPTLEALARELEVQDRVRFLGEVSKDRLVELYNDSDLFVLPASRSATSVEGFGIVYLEANACGVPVLAASLGGAGEAVEPGVSGVVVGEPTVEEVTASLSSFLRGEIEFSAAACRAFAGRFTWARVTEHVLDSYSRILGCGPGPRRGG